MQRLRNLNEAKTIYRYEDGYNELISYSTKERKPLKIPGGSITIAIIAAIIFSFIIGYFPQEIQSIFAEKILAPTLSTLMSLIITVTVFMIFFSIVAGICAIEDVTMLSNIGTQVVGRFFLIDVLIVVAELIIYAIIISFMLIILYVKTKVSIPDFLKKISPVAIISLTSGSSVASFPKSLEVSKGDLNIEEKFCDFWIPLSMVLFSPSKIIQLTMAGFYIISVTGESFSSPNAAGGIVASFTLLLTQLGLPVEYVGTLMIADVITGNLFTGLNVLIRQCELMTVAHKMNFIKSD